MRTVTFADPSIRKILKRNFECTYLNTKGDSSAGGSFAHDPKDAAPQCSRGNGEHNVQMLMLTNDGRLLDIMAGYVGAKDLAKRLQFALKLFRDKNGVTKEGVAAAHRAAHKKHAAEEFKGPLASFTKRRLLRDHRFVEKRPLLPVDSFRATDLVGNAKAFFGARNGTAKATATDHIGDVRKG